MQEPRAGAKGEDGKVKQGLSRTAALMAVKGYRTAGEMVLMEFAALLASSQRV